jgi:lysophospholipase L1-like esterase
VPPTGPADLFFPGTGLDTSPMNTYLRDNIATLSPFPIVDVVAAGLDDATELALWSADQVHPNTAGYQLYAQTLHDVVAGIE